MVSIYFLHVSNILSLSTWVCAFASFHSSSFAFLAFPLTFFFNNTKRIHNQKIIFFQTLTHFDHLMIIFFQRIFPIFFKPLAIKKKRSVWWRRNVNHYWMNMFNEIFQKYSLEHDNVFFPSSLLPTPVQPTRACLISQFLDDVFSLARKTSRQTSKRYHSLSIFLNIIKLIGSYM